MSKREIYAIPYYIIFIIIGLIYIGIAMSNSTKYIVLEERVINFSEKLENRYLDLVFSAIIYCFLFYMFFH